MSERKPAVAGSFYSADAGELKQDIHELFLGKFGPRKLPDIKKEKRVYGVIVPHAGYVYSGQAAAHSYKAIAEAKKPDTFIILGTNHAGYVESDFAVSTEDFETPLGIVKNDKGLSGLLISNGKGLCGNSHGDEIAHQQEHSIEVQLPFLQFIYKNRFKIVPIICQVTSFNKYAEVAKLLVETAEKLKRKICIIASSDFTHYGAAYGFLPFSTNLKENLYKLDKGAIDLILKFQTQKFLEYSSKTTICGAGAIAACIEACRLLGSKKAELLKYYTSGDIVGDYSSGVGYASIAFM